MKFWHFVLRCLLVGALAFVAGMGVSFFFNLIVHGSAMVAWGATLRLAVVLGLVIPLSEWIKICNKEKE